MTATVVIYFWRLKGTMPVDVDSQQVGRHEGSFDRDFGAERPVFDGCALAFSPMLDADTAWMILGGFGLAALNGWGIWVVARVRMPGGKDADDS